jgi:hypothetical protein
MLMCSWAALISAFQRREPCFRASWQEVGDCQHYTDPVTQVVQIQPTRSVMLTQQHDQPLAVGVPSSERSPAPVTAPGSLTPAA